MRVRQVFVLPEEGIICETEEGERIFPPRPEPQWQSITVGTNSTDFTFTGNATTGWVPMTWYPVDAVAGTGQETR